MMSLAEHIFFNIYEASELGHTSEENDIGVIIDSNLEFDKQIVKQ